jgi:hypothetical protein
VPLFSLPDDVPRIAALVAGLAAPLLLPLWLRLRGGARWTDRLPRLFRLPRLLWLLAPLASALLSWGYVKHYLRGGPRIIDATAYWLQARAMSAGMLAFPIGEPEHAVLGRFLLRTSVEGEAAASVIFPPGYPAVLALGFDLGVPMLVGPLLAAAITYATMDLTRRAARIGPPRWQRHEALLIRLAATISVLCAALRYHTADTMSHGLAALCVTVALCALLGPQSGWQRGWAPVGGLAVGLLFATRPVSAVALVGAAVLYLSTVPAARPQLRLRAVASFAAAAMGPILLWFAHQHAATGSFSATAQGAYYALSDGPPGCFRYGFGDGIGCLGEHGEFVRNSVGERYGLVAALGTTGRRLKMHLADALNLAPLFPLVLLGALATRRVPAARAISLMVLAQIACYAPFYFDGNYPGGGARMYADVLPAEQVLAVLGVVSLAPSRHQGSPSLALLGALTVALGLLGFAFRSGAAHQQLRGRDGGAPMFDPAFVATQPDARDALLLFDTDHGFNLAYQPGGANVARFHGDDLDRLTWEARKRPRVYRYQRSRGVQPTRLLEIVFDPQPTAQRTLTIEAESLWPPARQRDGWAWPSHVSAHCVSNGKVLALYPTSGESRLQVRLPAGLAGRMLTIRALPDLSGSGKPSSMKVDIYNKNVVIASRRAVPTHAAACVDLEPLRLPDEAADLTLEVRATAPVAIDSLKLGEKR